MNIGRCNAHTKYKSFFSCVFVVLPWQSLFLKLLAEKECLCVPSNGSMLSPVIIITDIATRIWNIPEWMRLPSSSWIFVVGLGFGDLVSFFSFFFGFSVDSLFALITPFVQTFSIHFRRTFTKNAERRKSQTFTMTDANQNESTYQTQKENHKNGKRRVIFSRVKNRKRKRKRKIRRKEKGDRLENSQQ